MSEDILSNHCRLAQSLSADNLDEILTYIVNRLLKGYPIAKRIVEDRTDATTITKSRTKCEATSANCEGSIAISTHQQNGTNLTDTTALLLPAIHLKVFYQVTAAPSVDLLLQGLHDFRKKCESTATIVYNVLPACSLHNFSTFLSICGVRHE